MIFLNDAPPVKYEKAERIISGCAKIICGGMRMTGMANATAMTAMVQTDYQMSRTFGTPLGTFTNGISGYYPTGTPIPQPINAAQSQQMIQSDYQAAMAINRTMMIQNSAFQLGNYFTQYITGGAPFAQTPTNTGSLLIGGTAPTTSPQTGDVSLSTDQANAMRIAQQMQLDAQMQQMRRESIMNMSGGNNALALMMMGADGMATGGGPAGMYNSMLLTGMTGLGYNTGSFGFTTTTGSSNPYSSYANMLQAFGSPMETAPMSFGSFYF